MNSLSVVRVLLVEDDREISILVNKVISKEGFQVVQAFDGREAIDKFQFEGEFQLVILDLMIPYLDGFELIKKIRQESIVPILVISAKNSETDKVRAMSIGADDYMVKPFSLNELVARIKALLRRYMFFNNSESSEETIVNFKDLTIDLIGYSIMKEDKEIKVTPIEFEIFKLFLLNPNKVFTKTQIYDSVWGKDIFGNDNTVMVHIKRLRDKIEDDGSGVEYIKTVWGIGYKLGE
jgi:DNA-binding response OmpR family regulator